MILKLKPFSGRSLTSSDAESVALLYAPTMLPVQRKEDVRCPMGVVGLLIRWGLRPSR